MIQKPVNYGNLPRKSNSVGYPGGEDQRDMDDEELNDFPFCECGNEPIEEEELTGHCFACGKELP